MNPFAAINYIRKGIGYDEFCAEYADRCALFFDGEIVSCGTPKEFFSGNSFYTTTANRVAGQWFPDAITWEEVAARCGGDIK